MGQWVPGKAERILSITEEECVQQKNPDLKDLKVLGGQINLGARLPIPGAHPRIHPAQPTRYLLPFLFMP